MLSSVGNGPVGPVTDTPAGPVGPVGAQPTLSVEKAWYNLMRRVGVTTPRLVQDGHRLLNGVDRITGTHSK